jgi:hypothetical protein
MEFIFIILVPNNDFYAQPTFHHLANKFFKRSSNFWTRGLFHIRRSMVKPLRTLCLRKKKPGFHTSVRPYLLRQVDTLVNTDSLYQIAVNKKWKDIVLNRRMVKLNKEELFFTIDPLFQFEYGKDEDQTGKSWINTRGIMVNARLGKKVAVTTLFRETQSLFNDYRHDRVQDIGVIPGQGRPKSFETDGYDYGIAEGTVTYQPDHHFTFTLGHGKNFFGDGYRSMMLSDNSFNYPYFRINHRFLAISNM